VKYLMPIMQKVKHVALLMAQPAQTLILAITRTAVSVFYQNCYIFSTKGNHVQENIAIVRVYSFPPTLSHSLSLSLSLSLFEKSSICQLTANMKHLNKGQHAKNDKHKNIQK
jgi:hypothetical protein